MNRSSRPLSRTTIDKILQGCLLSAIITVTSCTSLPQGSEKQARSVSFKRHIKPIFESSCLHCHNGDPIAGRLDLRNRDEAFRGGAEAALIVPGSPEKSRLFTKILLADQDPGAMPPTGHALSEKQIARVKAWIEQGAEWPAGEKGELEPSPDMDWRSH